MKIKPLYFAAMMTALIALLVSSVPVRASETDDRIESSFKTSYVYKTYLKDDTITISSKQGAVTLSGEVVSETNKIMAQDIAEALPGVTGVENNLKVSGESVSEMSDAWVLMKVKTALLFHRNVNVVKTDVSVKDGYVTLKGEASSMAQKDLAGEYAKDVDGVKGVHNQMTVAKSAVQPADTIGDKIDDASTTAMVKMTLLYHRSTSALKTKVSTTDGVVTVSGTAKNAAEKDLASKLVEDVNGVKNVVNTMTIVPKE